MVHIAKRQKVDELEAGVEAVLFNSDTLSKIISYLPSIDLLSLALTCKRFGIPDDDELSVIKKSTLIAVEDITTKEQLAALPHYEGESSLADYHYLQLLREPLTFDQLVGDIDYVNTDDKSCVTNLGDDWATAFSNNILRAGKHYVTFTPMFDNVAMYLGLMRPGKANQNAKGSPFCKVFFQNFSRRLVGECNNNSIQCCMYNTYGPSFSSDWSNVQLEGSRHWDGLEAVSSGDEVGMLLDLDEGTLAVFKNGRELGVMKKGLAGPYCWVVSMYERAQVTIKRGTIPQS